MHKWIDTISDRYELVREERIEDVKADGFLLRHRKTGARIALLSNDDDNKVFNIAFRTPPENSTGVAHIIEHTVLCGSRKFPLKDPFVELVKGSLNTFLNAMTYPDKTMYPVASCNKVDFQNLMDVYLDSVFYPNIYKNEKIFRQEGWHYQLEDEKDPITYSGVVYNEMKGAFSSAEEVLDRSVFNALFPDTPYGVESGGDPEVIPELTYEEFLNFHRTYYHPSNSYIYLYGDMDMAEKLDWLDREYLSRFDRMEVESEIPLQTAFEAPVDLLLEYPVLESESEEDKTYLAESVVVGDYRDMVLNVAFSVLEYVLLGAPGAPLKQALLDAGIGKDVDGDYNDGILQPFFSVIARNANPGDKDRFREVIRETLSSLAEEGLNRKALESGINYFEFRYREADYASYPKGLIYGINLFDSWLYDEEEPFAYLRQLEVFAVLKEKLSTRYFEEIIETCLLHNSHRALVTLRPRRGLAEEMDRRTAQKLEAFKSSLTEGELADLVRSSRELAAYQMSEERPEDIETIPLLSREDIDRKAAFTLSAEETHVGETLFLRHHYDTNGISYLSLLFDTADVPDDYVPYLGLLKGVLGVVDTGHYSYRELFHEINAATGGIHFALQSLPVRRGEEGEKGYRMFTVRAKYLHDKKDFVFDMIAEILTDSRLRDEKRMREILASAKAGLQHSIPAAGHLSAARRALSHQSKLSAWAEKTGGIDFYRLIEELESDFDKRKEEIFRRLEDLVRMIFRPENMTVSFTSDEEGFSGMEEAVGSLKDRLCREEVRKGQFNWSPASAREAFGTSGKVQYVAQAGNFRRAGYDYSGAFRVLRLILNYDYLWTELRTLGNAYGCMSAFKRSGDSYMISYRDPHLKRTLDTYRKVPDYLENFSADDREMTKYVIGTISEMDTPMNPSAKGELALTAYFAGLTMEDFQREREEVLDVTREDIRALAGPIRAVLDFGNVCVIGTEASIERHKELFDRTEPLVRG